MEHRSCNQASISPAQAPTPSSGNDTSTGERLPSEAMEPISLPMILLEKITNNFSKERVLGEGGYGKVYRGVYDDGQEIAVKLLHNNMQNIDDQQFIREFHNLMMLNHPNIIRLVGYCYETQRQHMEFEGRIVFGETTYKALCFEYMPEGSLKKHLSDECNGLDWQTRYKIIKGACEGLKYLHEDLEKPFYHLDLKPDNILLDENMVPKLADFGLSKLFGEEQTRMTQSIIGTIGYMPPEYLQNIVSKKSDIFSLGVVMTKIIAGPSGQTSEINCQEFLNQVQENWRKRLQATPSSLGPLEAQCQQIKRCTEIALSCMEMDRHKRPSIVDIIHELNKAEICIEEVQRLARDETPDELLYNNPADGFHEIAEQVFGACPMSFSFLSNFKLSVNSGSTDRITRSIWHLNQLEALGLSGNEILAVYKEVLLLPKLKHLLGKFQLAKIECSGQFVNIIHSDAGKKGKLASFKLRDELSLFSQFAAHLSCMKELCLWFTGLSWEQIRDGLNNVRGLIYLKLVEYNLGHIEIQPDHLRSIRRISLVSVPRLNIRIQADALPLLVSLHIFCQKLAVIPGNTGIEIAHMKNLMEVALHQQVPVAIKDKWQQAVDDHTNRPCLIFLSIKGP